MCDVTQQKKSRADKNTPVSIRLEPTVKKKLNDMARQDRRNLSQYIAIVLENHAIRGVVRVDLPALQTTTTSTPVTPSPIRQATAPRVPAVVQSVVDEEEGWEHGETTQVKR